MAHRALQDKQGWEALSQHLKSVQAVRTHACFTQPNSLSLVMSDLVLQVSDKIAPCIAFCHQWVKYADALLVWVMSNWLDNLTWP